MWLQHGQAAPCFGREVTEGLKENSEIRIRRNGPLGLRLEAIRILSMRMHNVGLVSLR
jgi:hypothetical protein